MLNLQNNLTCIKSNYFCRFNIGGLAKTVNLPNYTLVLQLTTMPVRYSMAIACNHGKRCLHLCTSISIVVPSLHLGIYSTNSALRFLNLPPKWLEINFVAVDGYTVMLCIIYVFKRQVFL